MKSIFKVSLSLILISILVAACGSDQKSPETLAAEAAKTTKATTLAEVEAAEAALKAETGYFFEADPVLETYFKVQRLDPTALKKVPTNEEIVLAGDRYFKAASAALRLPDMSAEENYNQKRSLESKISALSVELFSDVQEFNSNNQSGFRVEATRAGGFSVISRGLILENNYYFSAIPCAWDFYGFQFEEISASFDAENLSLALTSRKTFLESYDDLFIVSDSKNLKTHSECELKTIDRALAFLKGENVSKITFQDFILTDSLQVYDSALDQIETYLESQSLVFVKSPEGVVELKNQKATLEELSMEAITGYTRNSQSITQLVELRRKLFVDKDAETIAFLEKRMSKLNAIHKFLESRQ